MSQGIFIDYRRPKSKKEIKEVLATDPSRVLIERTSIVGDEYDGPASDLPADKSINFVGPDPFTKRNFYGTIKRKPDGSLTVS